MLPKLHIKMDFANIDGLNVLVPETTRLVLFRLKLVTFLWVVSVMAWGKTMSRFKRISRSSLCV